MPRSEIKLAKILLDHPAPLMSALSWVVLDKNTKEVLFGKLDKDRREVASLTKIMTIYTVLNLVDRLGIGLEFGIVIEESVNDVIGTSALL